MSIENVYLKKVWELTGQDLKGFLTVQRKQGKIYNIRPKNFTTSKTKKTNLFSSDKDFINIMAKTVLSDDEKKQRSQEI